MSEPENVISLVLGDWSGDGHSKTDTIVIMSSLNKKDVEKAYKNGTKKLGFDFINEVCEEYEDRLLPKDKLELLMKSGFKASDFGYKSKYELKELKDALEDECSPGLGLWIDTFPKIYLFIVKLGNEDFKYRILEGAENPSINIGGYGLYD